MSQGKETTTVMTLLGAAHPLTEPLVHDDVKDAHETDVNYEDDSTEEVDESASRALTVAGGHQTLGVVPTTALERAIVES